MLRWYLASLVFLLVVSPAIGFGVYHYVMTHPAEPGTLAGRVYEKTVKSKRVTDAVSGKQRNRPKHWKSKELSADSVSTGNPN